MPAAACSHALSEGPLRIELQLQFAAQILPHEFGVLANIGRNPLSDLLRFQKHAEAEVVDAAIVRSNRQVLRAGLANGCDQQLRNTTKTEPAGREKHSVEQQSIKGGLRALVNLVHILPLNMLSAAYRARLLSAKSLPRVRKLNRD